MRVRSSQFVFLLLLLCSVQVRDEYTLHLAAGAIAGHFGYATAQQESASAQSVEVQQTHVARQAFRLPGAAQVAEAAAWPMARPALNAAAVNSFTSFFRG